jgi:MFS family permease
MSECLAEKSRRAVSLAPNGLVVSVYLVVFMVLLDINLVVVALPARRTAVPLSDAASRWVATSYPLCVSALALSAGSIGDRFGRKRVFLFGVALFTAGSGLCAAAISAGFLIGARFAQGAGAAIAVPATRWREGCWSTGSAGARSF